MKKEIMISEPLQGVDIDHECYDMQLSNRIKEIDHIKQHVLSDPKDNIERAQERQKFNYDKKHLAPTFKLNDLILMKNMKNSHRMGGKLNPRWTGPYTILEVKPKGLYQLKSLKTSNPLKQAVSSTQWKPYIQRVDNTHDDGNEFEEQLSVCKKTKETSLSKYANSTYNCRFRTTINQ